MCIYIYIYTYMYIYIYEYTYINVYIYIYIICISFVVGGVDPAKGGAKSPPNQHQASP